jgi:hypothetical protein
VGEVLVHGPGLGLGGGDGNALLLGVVEQVLTALEALVEDGVAPRGNGLDVGLKGVEGKLEANLVITLTGAAVGDGEAALALLFALAHRSMLSPIYESIVPGRPRSGRGQ